VIKLVVGVGWLDLRSGIQRLEERLARPTGRSSAEVLFEFQRAELLGDGDEVLFFDAYPSSFRVHREDPEDSRTTQTFALKGYPGVEV
jgi:hypothetical protein